MLAALTDASKRQEGLRRTHDPDTPGAAPWPQLRGGPANANALAALVRRGFLTRERIKHRRTGAPVDVWSITDAGREALVPKPVKRRDTPQQLRVATGGTKFMQGGVWVDIPIPEPEKVKADDLGYHWATAARDRHEGSRDKAARSKQLARNLRAA
jgi:hypothetical protein